MRLKSVVLLLVSGLLVVPVSHSEAQELSWIRQFGTSGFDSVDGLAVDAQFAYATGRVGFGQALPGQANAGGTDAFVRKYAADGAEVWTRQFGTSGFDGFTDIVEFQGNVYVTGLTSGTFPGQTGAGGDDAFVRLYDIDGNEGWTRQLGTAGNDFIMAVAAHTSGVYVFGLTTGVFAGQTSAGGSDFFLAKLDSGGSVVWVHQFGTAAADPAIFTLGGVAVDDSGVYVGSSVRGFLPGQASLGDADAFLRKYDFDGDELWTDQFGTACADVLSGVAAGPDGLYLAGSTTGNVSDPFFHRCTNPPEPYRNFGDVFTAFVQRRTGDGIPVWSRQYEGSSGLTGFSLAIDLAVDATGVYIASEAIGPRDSDAIDPACPAGNPAEDIHVRAYDLEGDELWTQQIGSTVTDVPQGIGVNATGVYVGGVTFCQLAGQSNAGSADAVVLKLGLDPG